MVFALDKSYLRSNQSLSFTFLLTFTFLKWRILVEASSNISKFRLWMQWQLFFSQCKAKEMCLLSWLSRKESWDLINVFYKFYKFHKTVQGHFRSANGMDSIFLSTMYRRPHKKACTWSIGLITSYLTTHILTEIEEFQRTRTARGNSGIKQLCAFLIRILPAFFSNCSYMIMGSTIYFDLKSLQQHIWHNVVKIANSPLIRQYSYIKYEVMY